MRWVAVALLPVLVVGCLPLLGGADGATVVTDAPAHDDIPEVAATAYVRAATALQQRAEDRGGDCPISWALLAGIGKVETDHGRFGGSTPRVDGDVVPPILGVVLDGRLPGTRPVHDTDDGVLDGDPVYDRAVGPMQFIPGTWARYRSDGDGDGDHEPQNIFDATLAAATYLCAAATDRINTDSGRRQAVGAYNRSYVYVQDVLGWMTTYLAEATTTAADPPGRTADGGWTNPAPAYTRISSGYGNRVHPISGGVRFHAGLDLACPAGSPIVAAGAGRILSTRYEGGGGFVVWVEHQGGVRTRYLHLQAGSFAVTPGAAVLAGQHLADCGSTGNSSGPHLHLEVYPEGGGTTDPHPFLAERGVRL